MKLEPIDCDLVVSPENKFFLIPLQDQNQKPLLVRLSGQHFELRESRYGKEKSFSLGIELSNEDSFGWLESLEEKIQDLALKNLEKIQDSAKVNFPKLQNKFKYKRDDFQIIKKTRTGKSKIYAKVPFRNEKIVPVFWRARQCDEKKIKRKVSPFFYLGETLSGDVILEIKHIFVSEKFKTITCVVQEALFWEREEPETFFDDFEEESYSSDEEEDE